MSCGPIIGGEPMKTSKPFKEDLLRDLREPDAVLGYLNAVLEEGDEEALLLALRDDAEAHGVSKIARHTRLNRENLYKMLSKRGNPTIYSLIHILDAMGLRLAVAAKEAGRKKAA